MNTSHLVIFTDNNSNKEKLIQQFLKGRFPEELSFLNHLKGVLFSKLALEKIMDEEDRHGIRIIAKERSQPLRTLSSGEQKKALLSHLLQENPDFILLDNPFDNLDTSSQASLTTTLQERSKQTLFIQIISRKTDALPFIKHFAYLNNDTLSFATDIAKLFPASDTALFKGTIPPPLNTIAFDQDTLIHFNDVSVSFGDKTVIKHLQWKIKKGAFWQLIGKNGSGKTTILSMITGDNPKGYGQEFYLFGKKKGSGESIWDIKKKIGYYTPSMTDKFTGYHTVENMLISGLNDSIGLYTKPTETQLRYVKSWLLLLDFWDIKDRLFHDLTIGQQRLIMTTRAMIKHPLLLILDEPTAGLDDASAQLLVTLVNKIAKESKTATVFVSHRKEPGLNPDNIYELEVTPDGSIGYVR